jgi:glutamyl endopeptidase
MAQANGPKTVNHPPMMAEAVIGDVDDLEQVDDITVAPWSCIARLGITYQDQTRAAGTAWFFGPRALATAGHNIHHQDHGTATEILISPGFDGVLPPSEVYPPAQTFCDPAWLAGSTDPALDYGVLMLADPTIGARFGQLAIAAPSNSAIKNLAVQVSGYPGSGYPSRAQHFDGGKFKNTAKTLLTYTFDTFEGMSGSPLFAQIGGVWTAVGIHTSGSASDNRGRRIDAGLLAVLDRFAGG